VSETTERYLWRLSLMMLAVGVAFLAAALVLGSANGVVVGGLFLMVGGFGVPLFISIIEAFTKETRP
jgi:lipopolysaccharide export LptBFGC system permease protein LptF